MEYKNIQSTDTLINRVGEKSIHRAYLCIIMYYYDSLLSHTSSEKHFNTAWELSHNPTPILNLLSAHPVLLRVKRITVPPVSAWNESEITVFDMSKEYELCCCLLDWFLFVFLLKWHWQYWQYLLDALKWPKTS